MRSYCDGKSVASPQLTSACLRQTLKIENLWLVRATRLNSELQGEVQFVQPRLRGGKLHIRGSALTTVLGLQKHTAVRKTSIEMLVLTKLGVTLADE